MASTTSSHRRWSRMGSTTTLSYHNDKEQDFNNSRESNISNREFSKIVIRAIFDKQLYNSMFLNNFDNKVAQQQLTS